MPFLALRNTEGRAYIIHIDDPTPEEKEEEDRLYRAEEVDTGLAPNSNETTTRDPEGSNSSSTITPLSDGPKQEHFLIPLNPQPRSIASMPVVSDSDSDLDPLTPESSHDARWRRQNRITSYREITWPVTKNSRNVIQTQDPETLHLEKQRRDTKRMSDRYYLQKT